jgi:hypothetical protein
MLQQWGHGDDAALAELVPLIYEELRRLAHYQMAGQRPDHTLQTTALVNEAYLRLADQTNPNWQDRVHFFAVAARAMRQIVVDYARSYLSQKRGGGMLKIELTKRRWFPPEQSKEIVDLTMPGRIGHARLTQGGSGRTEVFRRAQLRRDRRGAKGFKITVRRVGVCLARGSLNNCTARPNGRKFEI